MKNRWSSEGKVEFYLSYAESRQRWTRSVNAARKREQNQVYLSYAEREQYRCEASMKNLLRQQDSAPAGYNSTQRHGDTEKMVVS